MAEKDRNFGRGCVFKSIKIKIKIYLNSAKHISSY